MGRRFAGWVLAGALAFASSAEADSMRCGTKLISDGDTMYEVRNHCGAPDQAVMRIEQRTVSTWVDGPCLYPGQLQQQGRCGSYISRTVDVQVDEWLYDFGTNQFIRTAVFESGHLVRIVSGGYGQKL